MKIYIAGNFPPKGSKHRELIKSLQKAKGNTVFDSADLPENMSKADYVRSCFSMIDSADKVFVLPGWKSDFLSQLEVYYSKFLEKHLVRMEVWIPKGEEL